MGKEEGVPATIQAYKAHQELLDGELLHGQEWVEDGARLLVSVTEEIKSQESKKETVVRLLIVRLNAAKKPFDIALKILRDIDRKLRERLLKEYSGSEPITIEDGSISFRLQWVAEIQDESAIPSEYRKTIIDTEKIKQDVEAGLRKIEGVRIYQQRTVVVKTEK